MKKVLSVLAGGLLMCVLYTSAVWAEASGREIVDNACSKCHSLDRVKTAKKSEAAWEATLNRMIKKGAEVTPQERERVLKYLKNLNKLS